jgi:hypothetical protein
MVFPDCTYWSAWECISSLHTTVTWSPLVCSWISPCFSFVFLWHALLNWSLSPAVYAFLIRLLNKTVEETELSMHNLWLHPSTFLISSVCVAVESCPVTYVASGGSTTKTFVVFWNVLFRNCSSFEEHGTLFAARSFQKGFKILKMLFSEYQILLTFSTVCLQFSSVLSVSVLLCEKCKSQRTCRNQSHFIMLL